MSTKELKTPRDPETAEQPTSVNQQYFGGMLKGDVPLSRIGYKNVYRHVNVIGMGEWAEGRPGTREFSDAVLPQVAFTANPANDRLTTDNRFETGDKVKCRTTGALPAPLVEDTTYYAIVIDTTTIELATTLANAAVGTQIDITDAGTGTHYIRYAADLYTQEDHEKEGLILKHYGRRVYVSQKNIEEYIEVLNMEIVEPAENEGKFAVSAGKALLAAGTVFRLVLDEDFYYMYRINTPLPTVLITDINETPLLPYLYRYQYSLLRISGAGHRNRITDEEGVALVHETGTNIDPLQEKYFGECAFANPVGDPITNQTLIEYLTCPIAVQSCQFFGLYRTKNIGASTGGEANNKAFYIWVEDVPVCKAFSITVVGNVATIAGPPATLPWVRGDVGCTLRSDAAGTRIGVIDSYISETQVNLVAGHTINAADYVAIGEGRVMEADQVGILVTRFSGDQFVAADEGRTLYWFDGGETFVKRYIDANHIEGAYAVAHARGAATIQLNVGTYAFRRRWNDSVIDDGDSVGRIGLQERIFAQRDLYIPNFNFLPIPSSNIVVSDSGFTVYANRDGVKYHYANIGAKTYLEGHYRREEQYGKLVVGISDIRLMPALAIFFCNSKTFNLPLNVPIPNVGDEAIGEFIQKLTEASEVDAKIGVIHYKTIDFVNASLMIALTNEPAIRLFDGHNWMRENLAIDSSGKPAVMDDLNKIDAYYEVIGWYSYRGGYKLFAFKWDEV